MNDEVKKQIARIMEAPVSGLMKLTDMQFDQVLLMLYAARYRPPEVKPKSKGKAK
jgi:hypothetical protein